MASSALNLILGKGTDSKKLPTITPKSGFANTISGAAGPFTTTPYQTSVGKSVGTGNNGSQAGTAGAYSLLDATNISKTTKKSGGGSSKPAAVNPYESQAAEAKASYDKALAAMPGAYESTWQGQIDGLLNGILNREKFNYNMDADPMYQQVRNNYVTQGRNAMRDTMGQAAALTGGYGSSYAQTAGQQAYQGYLQQLAAQTPQLYNLALSAYNAEGERAQNQLSALQQAENAAYGRYQDQYDRAADERAFWYNVYNDLQTKKDNWKG